MRIQHARAAKEACCGLATAAARTTTSGPDAAFASLDDLSALLSRMSVKPPAPERSRDKVAAALMSCFDAAVLERARNRPAAKARRSEELAHHVLELVAAASQASNVRVATAVCARAFAVSESLVEAARAAGCNVLGASLCHGSYKEADAGTEDRLGAQTTDRAKSVRQAAAEALGAAPHLLGTMATDALLHSAVRDPCFAVRAACLQALPAGGARKEEIARARAQRQGQGALRSAGRPWTLGDGPATNDGGGGPNSAAARRTEQAVRGC